MGIISWIKRLKGILTYKLLNFLLKYGLSLGIQNRNRAKSQRISVKKNQYVIHQLNKLRPTVGRLREKFNKRSSRTFSVGKFLEIFSVKFFTYKISAEMTSTLSDILGVARKIMSFLIFEPMLSR